MCSPRRRNTDVPVRIRGTRKGFYTQPMATRGETDELIASPNQKRTTRALAAHQLSTLRVTLRNYFQNAMRNDDSRETRAWHTHTIGQHFHAFACSLTCTRRPFLQYRKDFVKPRLLCVDEQGIGDGATVMRVTGGWLCMFFPGLAIWVLFYLGISSVAVQKMLNQEPLSRTAAFLNLCADLGCDLDEKRSR